MLVCVCMCVRVCVYECMRVRVNPLYVCIANDTTPVSSLLYISLVPSPLPVAFLLAQKVVW